METQKANTSLHSRLALALLAARLSIKNNLHVRVYTAAAEKIKR
jgi:hypothetical protein